jgi:hypothetical protein
MEKKKVTVISEKPGSVIPGSVTPGFLSLEADLHFLRAAGLPHVIPTLFGTSRKEIIMARFKSIFAVVLLAAIAGVLPQAHAQNLKVIAAGSSALWQTLALGAYNNGSSIVAGGGTTFHYTSGANFNLVDHRSTTPTVDNGATWIVWDSASPVNVWAFVKVDSVVGNRCYFAAPKCTLVTNGAFPAVGNQIKVWPDTTTDTAPPPAVQSLFTTGTLISVAATDIRPEDAAFAACRVNSSLGASTAGGANSDALDGLGYNTNNAAGVCPAFAAATAQAKGVGTPIKSGFPGANLTTDVANVLAFNLTGTDPITGTKLGAAYTVTSVGAAPIVFITAKTGALKNLHNASEQQLQQVFSGANCDASAFGLPAGNINIFLREPLSGTYNTTEATVMRYPTLYAEGSLPGSPVEGLSMETSVGANNPLAGQAGTCANGGARFRAIGTGEEVKSVQNSNAAGVYPTAQDGIGYTFFSYGNVASIAGSTSFGYITLNGVDPIFASYNGGDPGQPSVAGELPAQANLPAACQPSGFPCAEDQIWGNGFSFPNLRNGTYRSWSLLRLVSTGTPSTNAAALAKASNKYVVLNTPDYVPAAAVTGAVDPISGKTVAELGLKLVRSHYQQYDGNNVKLGAFVTAVDTCNVPEKGGDMGGMIIPTTIGLTTEKRCSIVQSSGTDGDLSPAIRPGAVVQ